MTKKEIEQSIMRFAGTGMLSGKQVCAFVGIRGHGKAQEFLSQLDSYDPNGSGRKRYFASDLAQFLVATQADIGSFNVKI